MTPRQATIWWLTPAGERGNSAHASQRLRRPRQAKAEPLPSNALASYEPSSRNPSIPRAAAAAGPTQHQDTAMALGRIIQESLWRQTVNIASHELLGCTLV